MGVANGRWSTHTRTRGIPPTHYNKPTSKLQERLSTLDAFRSAVDKKKERTVRHHRKALPPAVDHRHARARTHARTRAHTHTHTLCKKFPTQKPLKANRALLSFSSGHQNNVDIVMKARRLSADTRTRAHTHTRARAHTRAHTLNANNTTSHVCQGQGRGRII